MIIDALRDRYCLKELLLLFHLAKSSYFYQKEVRGCGQNLGPDIEYYQEEDIWR